MISETDLPQATSLPSHHCAPGCALMAWQNAMAFWQSVTLVITSRGNTFFM